MIIIQVAGGLGNQMQQYAMYCKLRALGKEVRLDLEWFDENHQKGLLAPRKCELLFFRDLPMDICSEQEREKFLNRSILQKVTGKLIPSRNHIFTESRMYHPEIMDFTDAYLYGFFLCQKYYDDISEELRQLFQFPEHTDGQCQVRNAELMQEMENRPSVSVHLRRGDYLTDPENLALFGNIATDAYYEAAMDYFQKKDPDTHFYFFSNDTEYVQAHFSDREKYTIVDWNTGENNLLDMELMSHCRGNICANSTFSFWGARLNGRPDREVIRTFTMRNNQACDPDQMHDYWKGWLLVDRDGKFV